jgi:hypothetical protein
VRRSALREAYFGKLLAKQQQQLQQRLAQDASGSVNAAVSNAAVSNAAVSNAAVSNASLLLLGHDHLVRYVEGFTSRPGGDVWLVFQVSALNLNSAQLSSAVGWCKYILLPR